jgi:hypothetical protein
LQSGCRFGRELRPRGRVRGMAAAAVARRAVQHQGAPLRAVQLALASRLGAIPTELISPDVRLNVPVPHDWPFLQERRPCVVYSHGLNPLKAWNYAAARGYYMRNISQLVAFLVDTLALVIPQLSQCDFPSVFVCRSPLL